MKMIQKNEYWLILLFFFLTYTMESAFAQKTNVDDMESLSRFMDSIVEKRFYKDEKKIFTFWLFVKWILPDKF